MIRTNEERLALSNCQKCVKWIRENYPHAMEVSYEHGFGIQLAHDTYQDKRIEIEDGRISYVTSGWGSRSSERADLESGQQTWSHGGVIEDVTDYRTGGAFVTFIHEWETNKPYIQRGLGKYERTYNFEP